MSIILALSYEGTGGARNSEDPEAEFEIQGLNNNAVTLYKISTCFTVSGFESADPRYTLRY